MPASPRDLEQVRALVALAADDRTPEAEARSAALQAARRIHKYDLLGLEAVKLARDLVTEAEADARDAQARTYPSRGEGARGPSGAFVRLESLLLVMSESSSSYRFARLSVDFRTKGAPCIGWIRKRYIHQTVWAPEHVARAYSTAGRRVVEALVVPQEYASAVRAILLGSER